jgi:hypothetical protein
MQKILSRGLNYQGQCGLGPYIQYTQKFLQVLVGDLKVKNIYTNYGTSYALLEGFLNIYIDRQQNIIILGLFI